MSFQLMVQVQTQAAEAAVIRVEQGLDKATTAAKRASVAGNEAGAKIAAGASTAAAALTRATTAAKTQEDALSKLARYANPFAALNAQFEREAAIVERIRGPMREYNLELVTLDAMHKRGVLTVIELNAEMTKLTKTRRTDSDAARAASVVSLGPTPAAATGPSIGSGLQLLAGGAAALGITEAISQVRELTAYFAGLGDTYIKVSNSAIKFVDASHDINRIVTEQVSLAHDLHSSFATTISLYDAVRDGTDELNFSHNDQARILKSLGQASLLAGRSLESVGGLVERLSYAAARGTIEQRDLNSIMKSVPEIADLWTSHFGKTRKEILLLVQQGKIGVNQLVEAFVISTDKLDQNYKKMQRTHQQTSEEFEKTVEMYVSKGDRRGEAIRKAKELAQTGTVTGYSDDFVGRLEQMAGLKKSAADLALEFVSRADDIAAASMRAEAALTQGIIKGMHVLIAAVPAVLGALADFARGMAEASADPWAGKSSFIDQLQLRAKIQGPVKEARAELETLRATFRNGGISAAEYDRHYKQLITTINDGRLPEAIKLWESINAPIEQWSRSIGAVNALYRSGRIDLAQYNAEVLKMIAANPIVEGKTPRGPVGPRRFGGIDLAIGMDEAKASASTPGTVAGAAAALRPEATPAIRDFNAGLERSLDLARELKAPQLAYEQRLEDIAGAAWLGAASQDRVNMLMEEAKAAYDRAQATLGGYADVIDKARGPAIAYSMAIERINRAVAAGAIDQPEAERQIKEATTDRTAAQLKRKGAGGVLERMEEQSDEFGKKLAGTLVDDIGTFSDAIMTAANGGKVAWGEMVDSMISDIEKLIVKHIAMQAIMMALEFAAPGSTAAGGFFAGLFGAATGGSGTVGGTGGTDSQVVAFRATPGERVTIQTPEQQAAGRAAPRAAAAAAPVIQIHNHYDKSIGVAAIKSRDGASAMLNTLRANPGPRRR